MSIRTRLTLWYAGIVFGSLLLMGGVLYYELVVERAHSGGVELEPPQEKIADVLVFYGVPTALVLVVGGSWLVRRALQPLMTLTAKAACVHAGNLAERIPRSGRGDEFDRLADAFNAMLGRVDTGLRSVRDFTLHAAHELKTPLTILSAQAETALAQPALAPAQREVWESQLEEVRRLAALVDALGLLAKADAGLPIIARQPARLDDLVRSATADAALVAASKAIRVAFAGSEAVWVDGDASRLRQLVLNLLDNAIKYNRPGGEVTVALRVEGGQAVLSVENSGESIPPELRARIFDRFVRGSSSKEGAGLGLSIAKTVVDAHGGTITAGERAGGGAVFTVRLPAAAPGTEIAQGRSDGGERSRYE